MRARNPDENLKAIGALLGYPPCCVAAFCSQRDRGDDARSRYATALRTPAKQPWSWALNNCSVRTIPFFPCSYTCTEAEQCANQVLDALAATSPEAHSCLRELLAAPVLFFDEHAFVRVESLSHSARHVGIPSGAPRWIDGVARVIATHGRLNVQPERIQVLGDGSALAEAHRQLPLGIWMPFGLP